MSAKYASALECTVIKKTYRSPFPALNIKRTNDPLATDTVYCDTSEIDDGSKCAQIFVGTKTLVSDVYGMKFYKNFVKTL